MSMKLNVISVEMTNKENASVSWDNPEEMILKLPYHATMKGFGGGFFENIDKIKEFYSKFSGSEKISGVGEWECLWDPSKY